MRENIPFTFTSVMLIIVFFFILYYYFFTPFTCASLTYTTLKPSSDPAHLLAISIIHIIYAYTHTYTHTHTHAHKHSAMADARNAKVITSTTASNSNIITSIPILNPHHIPHVICTFFCAQLIPSHQSSTKATLPVFKHRRQGPSYISIYPHSSQSHNVILSPPNPPCSQLFFLFVSF